MVFQPAQHWNSEYEAHVGRSELSEESRAIPRAWVASGMIRAACMFIRCEGDTGEPSMIIPEPLHRLLALPGDPVEP